MTIQEIKDKSGLKIEVAESLYWHSLKLRNAKPTDVIFWKRMLVDKKYREGR